MSDSGKVKWKKLKRSGTFQRKVKRNFSCFAGKTHVNISVDLNSEKSTGAGNATSEENISFGGNNLPQPNDVPSEEYISDEEVEVASELKKTEEFIKQIRTWATTFNIRQTALKSLLIILNNLTQFILPQDPRTLLETPKSVEIIKMGNGQYWHQGLSVNLKNIFRNAKQPLQISLNINIDGLPTAKSSKEEFWPILCQMCEFPKSKPMVIGIYSGHGKPDSVMEFLTPLVNDLRECQNIEINGHIFSVSVNAIICDSPARAFVKGVANFSSQNGCQRCTTVGEYSYESHCNIFPRSHCEKRTDEGFRQKIYDLHHKCPTPLEQLDIDMISDFPIGDSLHLIDLGIMKRCLFGWRDGSFKTFKAKWSAKDIGEISKFLLSCHLPTEIHRKVRGLDCLSHWKGLEYRSFFYYISIVVLKDYLAVDVYQHFLLLFCAKTICSSQYYVSKYLNIAESLLDYYVEIYRDIYGEAYITSNVHNLVHLADDVRRFGVLSSFHAYPFENQLYQIKLLLRQGNRALAQAAKRLSEIAKLDHDNIENECKVPVLKLPLPTEISGETYCSKIEVEDFLLCNDNKNCWYLTKNNKLFKYKYAVSRGNHIFIYWHNVKLLENFFNTPIMSSYLNIYISPCELQEILEECPLNYIKCKMAAINNNEKTIFIPLIHTLK